MKELPLNVWTPTSSDLSHTHQWLVGTPIQSPPNKLARVLLGQLNWGRKTEVCYAIYRCVYHNEKAISLMETPILWLINLRIFLRGHGGQISPLKCGFAPLIYGSNE